MIRSVDMNLSAMRRACQSLTPASLRLKGEGPRHLTLFSAVGGSDQDAVLTLEPLPAHSSPRASLDFQLDGQAVWVSGRLSCDGKRGQLTVRRPPRPRPAGASRAQP